MRVRLNSFSHIPGIEGNPGDELDLSPADAEAVLQRGIATPVKSEQVRTMSVAPQETAARTPQRKTKTTGKGRKQRGS